MLKTSASLALSITLLLGTNSAIAASSDGIPDGSNPPPAHYTDGAGADLDPASGLAPEATDHYLFIAGSALTPRNGSTTVTYSGAGCTTSSDWLTTDLQLPHGSTLYGVRTYYYDNAATGSLQTAVTRYDGQGDLTDLLLTTLPHGTGYANRYELLPTAEVINNIGYSYVLLVRPGTDTRICGLRVFYSTP